VESIRNRGVTVTPMRSRGVVNQPEDRHRPRKTDRPFLLEHDILAVRNVDDVTWEFRWDRRRYPIKPGETGYVPFPGMVNAMGDPRSMVDSMVKYNTEDGQRGVVLTRHEELCRLFANYGIMNENIDELVDFAPKLEVTTMEGDQVIFPAQDPEMIAFPVPNVPEPGREQSDQRRLMDQLRAENQARQNEIDELRSLIEERLGGPAALSFPDDGETDPLSEALMAGGAVLDTGPKTTLR